MNEGYSAVTSIMLGAAALAGGVSAYSAYDAKKDAEKEASKQQALIAEQEAKIQAEKDKQDKEMKARRERGMSNELLTGTETGITGTPQGTLLTGAK